MKSDKYFCPECKKSFDNFDDSDYDYCCPLCKCTKFLRSDDDHSALRSWLDPWHPGNESPEHVWGGGLFSNKKLCARRHGDESEYWIDFHVKNKGQWSENRYCGNFNWRDLP
jgi:hypothetical protein